MANNVWVVKEVTEGGVTSKVWAKEKTVHKVTLDSNDEKVWSDAAVREVVEDGSHNKSWEET